MDQSVATERNALHRLQRFARLPLHVGRGTLQVDGVTVLGHAEFILPAEGNALVAFLGESRTLTLGGDFASDLVIQGAGTEGHFRIHCPQCYTRRPSAGTDSGYSLISPVNRPVQVDYGSERQVRRCTVLLNNFDYGDGDARVTGAAVTRQGTPLRIDVNGRQVEFRWRPEHDEVLQLVRAHVLSSASLAEFCFEASAQEDDEQLMQFARDVAAICTVARGASVTIAMLEMRDGDDVVVRRVLPQAVQSQYRGHEVVADEHLQRLFRETFSNYVTMRQNHPPWSKLPSYVGSIEDCPYLEQKFASLMMALEFFMRNCLIEAGQSEDAVSSLTFHELIGATKSRLSWNVPKHYSVGQATRLLRNAVMHGGELPTKDNVEFRRQFDKWRLFLYRRVLVRLGYTGEVVSPFQGIESSSPVEDFSPEHNSFDPNGAAADSWIRFCKELGAAAGSENRQAAAEPEEDATQPDEAGEK
jgi:hypothetical protein